MNVTMRAVQIDRFGGPEVVVQRDLPVPSPGPGEVLVAIACAGINFMDIHTRQGKYATSRTYPMTLPVTLGIEGAGTVAALGRGPVRPPAGVFRELAGTLAAGRRGRPP